ncbi:hypothetical protein BFW38_17290 [Terasakiispira papahanaumokuakeensis]|uniref:DUF5801 domain-containing protein n=1 Tax=Terasakiispira papahanaumokuakeensis TaxID=197479 RepID=A0A1E2VDX5_9GAMM|nr:hypothetical protein BFW38_17290 [Terasakiispira papahanaumokuakeensis]
MVLNTNEAPSSLGGSVEGAEDQALLLDWDDLNISNREADQSLSIKVTALAGGGELQVQDDSGAWQSVAVGDQLTQAQFEANQVRFVPDENESGVDGYGGNGVGNQQANYAELKFTPNDGIADGQETSLAIDIRPIADRPDLSISVGEQVSSESSSTVVVHGDITITIGQGGIEISGSGEVITSIAGSSGNLHGDADADVIVLDGPFSEIKDGTQSLHSVDGGNLDYLYLTGSASDYTVDWSEQHLGSGIDGAITDSQGNTLSFNNVAGIIFGDGTSLYDDLDISTSNGSETYELNLAAALTDTDGSEVLSGVTLSGVPDGVTIQGDGVSQLDNGDWYVDNPTGQDLDSLDLSMTVPQGTDEFTITAEVTAKEIVGEDEVVVSTKNALASADFVDTDTTPTITVDQDTLSGLEVQTDESGLRTADSVTSTTDFSQALGFDYGTDGAGQVTYQLSLAGTQPVSTDLTVSQTGEAISLVMQDGHLIGQTVSGEKAFEVSVDQNGQVSMTQYQAMSHPDTTRADEVNSLDGLGIKLVVTATDADDNTSAGDMGRTEIDLGAHLSVEDDGVTLSQTPPASGYQAVTDGIPEAVTGSYGFETGEGWSSSSSFDPSHVISGSEYSSAGFTVQAIGLNADGSGQVPGQVYQSWRGLSVRSSEADGSIEELPQEISYRNGASEELVFKLEPGHIAYGLKAELSSLFVDGVMGDGDNEVAKMVFYRDGVKIAESDDIVSFSQSPSGDWQADMASVPGGFDEVRFMAVDNGAGSNAQNSDFAVKAIEFLGSEDGDSTEIAHSTGQVDAQAADGVTFELTGLESHPEYAVTLADDNHTLIARDAEGNKAFEVKLSQNTGTWDFLQYQALPEDVKFGVKATDGDGDTANTTVALDAYSGVEPSVTVDVEAATHYDTIVQGDIDDLGFDKNGTGYINDPLPPASTQTVTFDYGAENANKVITVTWNQQAFGGWEDGRWASQGYTEDTFAVYVNNALLQKYNFQSDPFNDNSWVSDVYGQSFQVVLDANGQATLRYEVRSTHPEETVSITDLQAALPTSGTDYPVTIEGTIESGHIASYLVTVEGGTLLHNGTALTPNDEGQYELTPDQLSGLSVDPAGEASDIQVSATAVSDLGVESPLATDAVAVETSSAPTPDVSVDIHGQGDITVSGDDINDLGNGHGGNYVSHYENDVSSVQTLDFGAEHAGETVTLSWSQVTQGGWDSSGLGKDTLQISVNGSSYEVNAGVSQASLDITLDANGQAVVQFQSTTNWSDERISISNLQAVLPGTYDVDVNGTIDASSQIVSYVVTVEGGTLMHNGQAVPSNGHGASVLRPDQLSGLTIEPSGGADQVQITAVAVSSEGVRSAPATDTAYVDGSDPAMAEAPVSALALDVDLSLDSDGLDASLSVAKTENGEVTQEYLDVETSVSVPQLSLVTWDSIEGAGASYDLEVTLADPDADWSYSLDGGENWLVGSETVINLPEGEYAAGDILVQQTLSDGSTVTGELALDAHLTVAGDSSEAGAETVDGSETDGSETADGSETTDGSEATEGSETGTGTSSDSTGASDADTSASDTSATGDTSDSETATPADGAGTSDVTDSSAEEAPTSSGETTDIAFGDDTIAMNFSDDPDAGTGTGEGLFGESQVASADSGASNSDSSTADDSLSDLLSDDAQTLEDDGITLPGSETETASSETASSETSSADSSTESSADTESQNDPATTDSAIDAGGTSVDLVHMQDSYNTTNYE